MVYQKPHPFNNNLASGSKVPSRERSRNLLESKCVNVNIDVGRWRWKATLVLRQSGHNGLGKEDSAVNRSETLENCEGGYICMYMYIHGVHPSNMEHPLPLSQCVCIGVVALPVGLRLATHFPFTPILAQSTPTMADTAQPAVSEIVSRADEFYDSNRMREGLTYVIQYAHLDEVEVRAF